MTVRSQHIVSHMAGAQLYRAPRVRMAITCRGSEFQDAFLGAYYDLVASRGGAEVCRSYRSMEALRADWPAVEAEVRAIAETIAELGNPPISDRCLPGDA